MQAPAPLNDTHLAVETVYIDMQHGPGLLLLLLLLATTASLRLTLRPWRLRRAPGRLPRRIGSGATAFNTCCCWDAALRGRARRRWLAQPASRRRQVVMQHRSGRPCSDSSRCRQAMCKSCSSCPRRLLLLLLLVQQDVIWPAVTTRAPALACAVGASAVLSGAAAAAAALDVAAVVRLLSLLSLLLPQLHHSVVQHAKLQVACIHVEGQHAWVSTHMMQWPNMMLCAVCAFCFHADMPFARQFTRHCACSN